VDCAVSRFLAFSVSFLGAWAVVLQIGVQAGITFQVASLVLWPSLAAGLIGAWLLPPLLDRPTPTEAGSALSDVDAPLPASQLARFVAIAGAILAAFAASIAGSRLLGVSLDALFFLAMLGLLGWGLLRQWRSDGAAVPRGFARPVVNEHPIASVALLFLAALVPLVAHRADIDDANFLNIATGMMADPRPILTWDTILGDPRQPIMLPSYRVEVIYALFAALSAATGLEVIEVAHLAWPVFAALVMTAAYFAFARVTGGRVWLVAFLASLAFLLVFGGVHHSFGNFSFVRFQQGKSLLFVGLVPLIYLFAIRFWERGGVGNWVALALTQAAGTGLSANGVFLCPMALLLVGAALLMTEPLRIGRLILLGLSGFWPICAGLAVLLTTGAVTSEIVVTPGVVDNVRDVFGALQAFAVVPFVFAGWALLRGWTGRFYLGCALAFTLLVLNPVLNPILADRATGNLNWRLFFAFPAPLFAGLALARLWGLVRDRVALPGRDLLAGLAILLVAAVGPASVFWQSSVRFGLLQLDVDESYASARALHAQLPPGAMVLAPLEVAVWLSTMENPRPLVATRPTYLIHYSKSRSPQDVAGRQAALDLVTTGKGPALPARDQLEEIVERYQVTDLVVGHRNPRFAELERALATLGWRPVGAVEGYVHFQR
jgi:hypothetical protein